MSFLMAVMQVMNKSVDIGWTVPDGITVHGTVHGAVIAQDGGSSPDRGIRHPNGLE